MTENEKPDAEPTRAMVIYLRGRRDEYEHTAAWVEKLASEWERAADQESTWRSYSLMACAAELRARALPSGLSSLAPARVPE